mgnify:CR=1 FL=1|jgi:hypothetical protein
MNKQSLSAFAWLSIFASFMQIIGLIVSVITHPEIDILAWTILAPITYLHLWLFGDRNQIWYDNHRIQGGFAAFTFLVAAHSAIISAYSIYMLEYNSIGGPLLLFAGSILLLERFILNLEFNS